MKLAAIIVAAGSSQRMGFDKLLAPLAGKPVLLRSIEAFDKSDDITNIIVVCPLERFNTLDLSNCNKPIQRIDGGLDRHDSVAAGLATLANNIDHVAVHDGARPLISNSQISRVYQAAIELGGAASARPVTETIKRADDKNIVTKDVTRNNLWLMETPQIFQTCILHKAYEEVKAQTQQVTDEVSALQLINRSTKLVTNDSPNPKITYPQDLQLAEKLLAN